MARKKYRPGMNCEKTGKYACYDANGNEMYRDIDVEKDRLFARMCIRKILPILIGYMEGFFYV